MSRGKIFSIEEFSVYDGPGIRTSVFLKGCPLRCMWCHNPEGQAFEAQFIRSPSGCLGCGRCLEKGEEITGERVLVRESADVCPRRLIRLCGQEYDAQELAEKVRRNAELLNASGGGVTFSGGEPLAQPDFLLDCLKELRGITHRAIQTTGYASKEIFEKILAQCDYVLYDLKLIDDELHRYYTGVSNERILDNFRTLADSGVPFCVRTPLIPGVTDTEANAENTAELLRACGVKGIELLPYNKMAGGKYLSLGRAYRPEFDEKADVQIHRDVFEKNGVEVSVL